MIFINYADRVNLSVAAPAIAKEMGWDAATMGCILSSFSRTYALFLIPMGWLANRFGSRKISSKNAPGTCYNARMCRLYAVSVSYMVAFLSRPAAWNGLN